MKRSALTCGQCPRYDADRGVCRATRRKRDPFDMRCPEGARVMQVARVKAAHGHYGEVGCAYVWKHLAESMSLVPETTKTYTRGVVPGGCTHGRGKFAMAEAIR